MIVMLLIRIIDLVQILHCINYLIYEIYVSDVLNLTKILYQICVIKYPQVQVTISENSIIYAYMSMILL